jgi:sterol desaturase/sphingolipid hydroxylase (fatty acid hydroxylase superfamily)
MVPFLERVLHVWWGALTTEKAIRDYFGVAGILIIAFLLDRARGGDWRRYFSRAFATDATYYVFYYGGFFALLYSPIGGAMVRAVDRFVPFLHVTMMRGWPVWLQIPVFIVVADFLSYWQHRLMHSVPALWSIHQIHHSQRSMTVFTNFRFHFLEESIRHLFAFVPYIVLGAPVYVWILADLFMGLQLLMQHSTLHWRFGALEHVFVSPRYHELHHARERQVHDHNYSAMFSFWDRLFGTQDASGVLVTTYGTEEELPESFFAQLLVPMRAWARMLRAPRTVVVTPVQSEGQA